MKDIETIKKIYSYINWYKKTKNHPKALRNITFDSQLFAFLALFVFCVLFSLTSIIGKPMLSMWFLALLSIQLIFKTAMNYSETEID